jgi:hypothetical protein
LRPLSAQRMELSCGPPATTARHTRNDTTGASYVPLKAALQSRLRPAARRATCSWSDWLGLATGVGLHAGCEPLQISQTSAANNSKPPPTAKV